MVIIFVATYNWKSLQPIQCKTPQNIYAILLLMTSQNYQVKEFKTNFQHGQTMDKLMILVYIDDRN